MKIKGMRKGEKIVVGIYLHMEYNGKTKGAWDVILLFKIFIVTGGME